MVFRVRPLLLSAGLLAALHTPCFADTFLLKSGTVVRGKLVEKTAESYVILPEDGGEKVEISVNSVSIADFDPNSNALPKGTISLLDTVERRPVAPRSKAKKETSGGPTVIVPTPSKTMGGHPYLNVLKTAEDTVALHNAKTEQLNKQLSELKDIADASQGRTEEEPAA